MGSENEPKSLSEAAGIILHKICSPAADEIGGYLAEWARKWRGENAEAILDRAHEKYDRQTITGTEHAPPRLVYKVLDEGSWTDDAQLQEMWAGLLVSSCSQDGQDDSNLIFINTLEQLTSLQAKILSYACKNSIVKKNPAGLIYVDRFAVDIDTVFKVAGIEDILRLDGEFDHMRSLELIKIGFNLNSSEANLTPSGFALQMYARCQGFMGSPLEFYGLEGS